MSAALLFKAFRAKLPPDQKLVLMVLSDHADEVGFAWPTLARLADTTGYSAQEVQAALRALQTADVITINPTGSPAAGKPNRYFVRAGALDKLSSQWVRA